jgi:hypothetical protein
MPISDMFTYNIVELVAVLLPRKWLDLHHFFVLLLTLVAMFKIKLGPCEYYNCMVITCLMTTEDGSTAGLQNGVCTKYTPRQ